MAQGKIGPPNLDDRTRQDLVNQARDLVGKYAPQWTDPGPSDPGTTLIELFAWLVKGMIDRLNRVPEKNYIAFLNLLGLSRSPASPATAWLNYTCSRQVTLPAGTQAATQQTESLPAVVFETDEELTVVPTNLVRLYVEAGNGTHDLTSRLVAPSTPGRGITGWDGEVPGDGGKSAPAMPVFWLGFESALATTTLSSHLEIAQPRWAGSGELKAEYWNGKALTGTESIKDETSGLRRSGRLMFGPLAGWSLAPFPGKGLPTNDPDPQKPRAWVKLALINGPANTAGFDIKHIFINSVSATAVVTALDEFVGLGTGQPYQTFELANRPLYKDIRAPKNPYGHVQVWVQEGADASTRKPWALVLEFSEDDNQSAFRLDPVTGTIYFGGGRLGDAAGKAPPEGSRITASYRYVPTGKSGNVPAGFVNTQRDIKNEITAVINPAHAFGGYDEEDVERTKELAPQALKNFDRALTLDDYQQLVFRASRRVKKACCLGPRLYYVDLEYQATDMVTKEVQTLKENRAIPQSFGKLDRGEGSVSVIIIPDVREADDPRNLDAQPRPTAELIAEVKEYLDDRCAATANLVVTWPRYLKVSVEVQIQLWCDDSSTSGARTSKDLADRIDQRITLFLHPVKGHTEGNGWEFGESLFLSGLFEFLEPTIGEFGYIKSLTATGTPDYVGDRSPERPNLDKVVGVGVAEYEIVCSGKHTVTLAAVKGTKVGTR